MHVKQNSQIATKAKPARTVEHVAIIMDGNGRWAKERGLPRLAGHRAGTDNLRRIIESCVELGIKRLTIYAFSTENWNRPKLEVRGLMRILEDVLDNQLQELHENDVQIHHIGRLDGLSERLANKVQSATDYTRNNTGLVLNVAFNYGGRDEIVHAVKRIVAEGYNPEDITEETINRYLFTAGQPDPDLIIRTSGEIRVSNFLIWQGAYSEWHFTSLYWPEFGPEELRKALDQFQKRERRFGMISEQVS